MIIKRLVVGPLGTNCYLFGSNKTREIVIIDPGGDAELIIEATDQLGAIPTAVLLTHGHFDHTTKVGKIMRNYDIPLMYHKREYESGVFTQKLADRWLVEEDIISIGELNLHTLETPGHSPGSLCFYSNDVKEFNGQKIEGVLFSGDLLFRGSIGRSDFGGGDQNLLFSSIKNKIMYNPAIGDNFIIFPGHMEITTVRTERESNMFRNYFL